jgi:AcrR family transcriptional regulator
MSSETTDPLWLGTETAGSIHGVTSSGGRREDKRRQTGARIFEVAMRLLRERGYEEVSVGEIAAAAGVSVPTFYAHYESKDHLILALPTADDVVRLVRSFPADMPIVDLLRGIMVTTLTGGSGIEAPERVLERWRIIAASPALRLRAAGFERATAGMVLAALPPEQRDDPRTALTITALMTAYTQILLHWAESDGKRPIDEVMEEVLGALRDLRP